MVRVNRVCVGAHHLGLGKPFQISLLVLVMRWCIGRKLSCLAWKIHAFQREWILRMYGIQRQSAEE